MGDKEVFQRGGEWGILAHNGSMMDFWKLNLVKPGPEEESMEQSMISFCLNLGQNSSSDFVIFLFHSSLVF